MQDLSHAARYNRMSSNPTGGFLIKFFSTFTFLGSIYIMCFFIIIFAYGLFVLIFVLLFFLLLLLYCIVFFNITMKFQDASCPSLAMGVLSSSVEPPSQSLAVSVSFFNVRFDRATFPFSIAQISSFALSSGSLSRCSCCLRVSSTTYVGNGRCVLHN